ncbi:MAG: hypothetical protein WAN03_19170 [Candidatus Sulfotelmatobacter sp.]
MSLRNRFALPFAILSLAFLAACGSSSSPKGVAPPSGAFSNSNLNGTYVFSVSGTDVQGADYSMVGAFTATGGTGNGSSSISGGTVDINDENTSVFTSGPIPNAAIGSNSTFSVGVDGRGKANLTTQTPFGTIVLDFVLQDSSHGLVTEFDGSASGSGTLDIQTSGTTPSGAYAFSFTGVDYSTGNPFATVGNFTVSGGAIQAGGMEDFNDGGFAYTGQLLSGTVVAGPSSTPGSTLSTGQFGALAFDVYPIDANHLKFIEMDEVATFSGDAYSQSSTSVQTGTLPFVLEGFISNTSNPTGAGGFMVTDGSGGIAGTEDVNLAGSVSPSPLTFSANYAAAGTGRYILNNFAGFTGGTEYVAYPFSGGMFLLEIDNGGLLTGASYLPQTSTTFAASQGYGLNFTGINLSGVEVDDVAEFTASTTSCGSGSGQATGNVISGLVDENYAPSGVPISSQVVCGNFSAPDSNGRGQIDTVTTNTTINGGFLMNYYSVDGTTFPFIETDSGQVSAGVMFEQNASGTPVEAKAHAFVVRPLVRANAARAKQKK